MKKSFILIATTCAFLTGCKNETSEECAFVPETSVSIQLNWESLEDSLPAITSKKELVDFLTRHAVLRDVFFNRPAYPSDSVFIDELYRRFTHPSIDTLLGDTHQVYGDLTALKHQFEKAFANFKYYYPDFQPPKIQTVITGLETDLFVSDSLIIIGLDHFLGPGARYEPNMYDYMKKRYHQDFIVPSVMLLFGIDNRYNKINPADRTILGDMIAYGKAYYFSKLMTPCTPDSVLIGYSSEEMTGARENEDLIWSRLVEDQVLFSTSNQDKQKYIFERPRTLEVGEKCPGRIGTWVGWQIVKQYHGVYRELSLPEIMSTSDAAELFKASGYRPQIVKVPSRQKF